MSYIKSESSDDELTIFKVKDEPILTFISPIGDFPPEFQKKKLIFAECEKFPNEYNNIGKELQDIDKKLIEIASQVLFKWEDVVVSFPVSITGIDNPDNLKTKLSITDNLFSSRTSEELDELATDHVTGKTKRLNKQQLDSIKKTGSFEVESKVFNGKNHKWVLAKWIQKGSETTNQSFFWEMSRALKLIIITAKRRFYSKKFSILKGLKSWISGFRNLADLMIGIPEMRIESYHEKLSDDLTRFLVEELILDNDYEQNLETFGQKLKTVLKDKKFAESHWNPPVYYKTPDNLKINFSLYDHEKIGKIDRLVESLLTLTENEKSIIDKLRIETVDIFKNENLDNESIRKRTEKILFKEYINMVFKKILNSNDIEMILPGAGKLLIERAKTIIIMKEVFDQMTEEMDNHLDKHRKILEKNNKIKSLISEWVEDEIDKEKNKFVEKNLFEAYTRSIKRLKDESLFQSAYFLQREMLFYKEKKDSLIKQYEKIKEPVRKYHFNRRIWSPKNYIIKNSDQTGISPKFYAEKIIRYENSTKYPFWRWTNFLIRSGVNFLNFIFLFGVIIPFCSPVSLRALVSSKPFHPEKDVDPKTGSLIKTSKIVKSYVSRIRALWSHIRKSRNRFENTPDKGLIGKGLQRIFNRFWNYIIKGLFGTIGITAFYPGFCIICSIGSLALCITTPFWVPIFSIVQHFGFMFIFDWDYPYSKKYRKLFRFFQIFIWNFFICGILQPIGSLLTSLILCPIGSLAICLFSISTMIFRKIWDGFIFHAILKRRARVPSIDSFIARRVEGPGLSFDYFIQARPEQILASLEINLERKIIRAYLENVKQQLEQPKKDFEKLFTQIFRKYSFILSTREGPYQEVENNINQNISKYEREANRRIDLLNKLIDNNDLTRIRLSEKNLKIVILESIKMIKKHYMDSIIPYSNKSTKEFFDHNYLRLDDWNGMAEIELEELFGKGFLCPLEQTDFYFSLTIDHLNLGKYTEMLANSEIRDDLDKVLVNYNPKCEKINISSPRIDIGYFMTNTQLNTRHNMTGFNLKSKYSYETISIPTKISDTCTTAALVYNNKFSQNKIEYKKINDILYHIDLSIINSKA